MSEQRPGEDGERSIRSDQSQAPRGSRAHQGVAARRRYPAGEYGEGAPHESTGVGPRRAGAEPQVLNDRPGHPDSYGNVAPGAYGAHGYSGDPGHPSAYAQGSGVPGAVASPPTDGTGDVLADDRLRELIRERLTEDPDVDAREVIVEVQAGSVTLSGSVGSERTRDIVEQAVENCGARAVRNQLRIR